MNIFLWIIQGLLAAMFFMAGLIKLTKSKDDLKPKMGDWVDVISNPAFRLIGLLELLAAIGLVVPMAIDFLPVLTPFAALGLTLTMVGAMILHLQRKEKDDALKKNVPLLLLASFVALGRFFIVPVI